MKAEHLMVEVARVNPELLMKPTEPPLLIRPTDAEFVQNLALHMMKNPIAVVAPWLCVVIGPKGLCHYILESFDHFA